jgi:hypothetical protein
MNSFCFWNGNSINDGVCSNYSEPASCGDIKNELECISPSQTFTNFDQNLKNSGCNYTSGTCQTILPCTYLDYDDCESYYDVGTCFWNGFEIYLFV